MEFGYQQEKLNNPNNNSLLDKFKTMILSPNKKQLAQRTLQVKLTNNAELVQKINKFFSNSENNLRGEFTSDGTNEEMSNNNKQKVVEIINKNVTIPKLVLSNNNRNLLKQYEKKYINNSDV